MPSARVLTTCTALHPALRADDQCVERCRQRARATHAWCQLPAISRCSSEQLAFSQIRAGVEYQVALRQALERCQLRQQVARQRRSSCMQAYEHSSYASGAQAAVARDLLAQLATLECLRQRYLILDTSADLRECQRSLLQREMPQLAPRVAWPTRCLHRSTHWSSGNEVLDAMPDARRQDARHGIDELGVTVRRRFEWSAKPASGALLTAANDVKACAGLCH